MTARRRSRPVDWREVRAIMRRAFTGRGTTPDEHDLLCAALEADRVRYLAEHAAVKAEEVDRIRRFGS